MAATRKGAAAASANGSSGGKRRVSTMAVQAAVDLLQSAAAGRSQMVRKVAGVQYGGERDVYKTAGYVPQGKVTFAHYWGLYTRGDIAGRIVDMPAKTTWRTPPEITEPDAPPSARDDKGQTEFIRQFYTLAKRVRLWQYLARADRVAGVGRYGVLYLGLPGDDTAQAQDPGVLNGPQHLRYLSVYHEANAEIVEWEQDVQSPRFGLPLRYALRVAGPGQGAAGANAKLKVHHSRILHIAEDLVEDDVYGRPRLERALNRLFDLDKVAASTGEAYWQAASRILQAKVDSDVAIDDAKLRDLDEKLLALVHDLRRQFTGKGVELGWLDGTTPNVGQVADFFFSLIAGACGIPKRILFGSELGELASTTDQATYLGMINERQEQFAEPMLLRAFIDRMVRMKVLPAPASGEYAVVWPNLFEESDTVKAEASLKRAQTAQALTPVGGDPRALVVVDDNSEVWLKPLNGEEDLPSDDLPLEDDEDDDDVFDGGDDGADDDSATPEDEEDAAADAAGLPGVSTGTE